MPRFTTGLALGVALALVGTTSVFAQGVIGSQRYATDPDPFVYNRLDQEHRALSHSDAVTARSNVNRNVVRVHQAGPRVIGSPRYATDPDPFVYNRLDQEHRALSHSDAVEAYSARAAATPRSLSAGPTYRTGVTAEYSTDPDPRIRAKLRSERNVW
ncbi:hypothetical protein GJ689_15715 [Rhodoplanes serenus]|jgi:hypothetical protein|uniref:Uncharacterized protein n=1 Tax=Rhodoplanes serenus TaxID=200615 RepID=A0A327K4W6_9BRAD|nr:hypothetical protein [Rhodoplanes serenus]MTW17653.1 hypothetical protein [Rhodoplanes serenus]RAI33391.1 hypothetical protein CH340_12480 [Rhodoplanes serenus]